MVDLATLAYIFSEMEVRCRDALQPYVGRPIELSRHLTFPVVPPAGAQSAGALRRLWLVARKDGQWMDQPARGSGE